MRTLFKTLHFVGLALFLGSIVSYIVVGIIAEDQTSLNFSRTFVLTGTQWLTMPAM